MFAFPTASLAGLALKPQAAGTHKEGKMRRMLNGVSVLFLAIIGMQPGNLASSPNDLFAQESSQAKDTKVDVKVVKYDGLKQAVTDLKGKFVVVDFWSTT